MTPTPFAESLHRIGWSAQTAADRLDIDPRTVRRWISGQMEPPAGILAYLARLADLIEGERFDG